MAATENATDAPAAQPPQRWTRPPLGPHTLTFLFVFANLVFAANALIPELFSHGKGKDYPLWYGIGRVVLRGGDLYTPQPGGQSFAFLYPPFAAVLMAPFSLFGKAFSIACIVAVNIASWWAAVKLSDRLSAVPGEKVWWVYALPSVLSLAFIWDMFDLGQPNLMLLAMMLAGLALMQSNRGWAAGAMFAAATALKAFPIAILPYLIWRRRWKAAAGMAVFTAVFLVLVPAPFRGFERNLQDLKTWSQGMVFSANEKGFGQRPGQNWSWKNQSLIAVTHRFLRPVNAEAEDPKAAPIYVNVANLTYDQANLALLAIAGLIGVGFVAAMPPERRRTPASDAAEYALLITLMTIASPLARAYYFIWLLFPLTLLIYRAALDPAPRVRRVTGALVAISVVLFTIGGSYVVPHWPQALGDGFWATCLLVGALVWHMRRSMAQAPAA
ncbi:MAG: glycosyltransferase family 87 protein [Caulobacterales bacterium]